MIFKRVDFPAPFGPSTPILTPGKKLSVSPFNTVFPPGYVFTSEFMT
jgi:hypothetical protein